MCKIFQEKMEQEFKGQKIQYGPSAIGQALKTATPPLSICLSV